MDDRAADFAPYFPSGAARGGSLSQKSLNLKKAQQTTESDPKTDHGGKGEIKLVTLFVFAAELVAWRRQVAQMCAFADT